MSDRQILAHITNASSSVCGRFNGDQLNKDLVVPENRKRFSWAYIWNVAIASFLVVGKANAQADPPIKGDTVVELRRLFLYGEVSVLRLESFKGVVIDAFTKLPVPGANIRFKGSKNGVSTDASGNFKAPYYANSNLNLIEVTAKGYKTAELKISGDSSKSSITVYLTPTRRKLKAEEQLQALQPKNMCAKDVVVLAGEIMPRYNLSKTGKIIRSISDTVLTPFKRDVKVYPNPVTRGSDINLSLSFKEAGEYKAELMDAEGRVVLIQSLIINAKGQTAQLQTNPSWSPGTYWLRFSGRNNKSVYQGKIIIE
jgi:hypothetical protein